MFRYIICLISIVLWVPISGYGQTENSHQVRSIYFGGGSYYIDDLQRNELQKFIGNIQNLEQYSITIHSHTDSIGGPAYNEWLSEMRSNAVAEELFRYSISKDIIEIKDFGQFNPTYDNSTLLGRLKNRRVDIIFWPISL